MKSIFNFIGCALAGGILLGGSICWAEEEQFATPEDAVKALAAAAANKDTNALNAIFGPSLRELVSSDPVQASNRFTIFARRISEKTKLNKASDTTELLDIGNDNWPFPIPVVERDGKWFFDTHAGKEEILNRRIGADELGTIRVCRAYVEAQREYASETHDGDEVLQYAQHLRSDPGKHNGLYWHAEPGEEISPLGPLIAAAKGEGYRKSSKIMAGDSSPYHGYLFKILTRQGSRAPGGKFNYIINDRMLAGFALVAWPAQWGNTGIMTFIVGKEGKVYQKNLGPNTASIAERMNSFDPDDSWKVVSAP